MFCTKHFAENLVVIVGYLRSIHQTSAMRKKAT